MTTAADRLPEEARRTVDEALRRRPPMHVTATCDEIGSYLGHAREALAALLPWQTTVVDQVETATLLEVLVRLHEMHLFGVEEDPGDPSLWTLLSSYRTSIDRMVATPARLLFTRMCALKLGDPRSHRLETKGWMESALGSMPPPPPSPTPVTPGPGKRPREEEI